MKREKSLPSKKLAVTVFLLHGMHNSVSKWFKQLAPNAENNANDSHILVIVLISVGLLFICSCKLFDRTISSIFLRVFVRLCAK